SLFAQIAGVVIILFGLHLTGIFKIKALYTDARLHNLKGGSTPFGAFLIGFAFAFGWTPCVGPILAVILGFAAAQDSVLKGIMLVFGFHKARRNSNPIDKAGAQMKGQPAPEFTLQSLDGNTVRLADFRGKGVLLNFWATWCQPCKIEMPWFVELQKQYGPQGLQVVGVAMDDASPEDIGKFAKDLGVNYPVLIGKEAVGDAYGGIPFMPETF